MISLIFYRCLFIFMSPVLALELSRGSNAAEVNFSDEQWDLLKNAIFSNPADFTNQEWGNKFDSLFNKIPELYAETLDAQPIAIPTPKKSSRNTYRTCPLCEKSVSKISVHLRYHKDEYNYPCDQCPCMFKEACNLNKHKKKHETKRARESGTLLGLSANLFGNLNKTGSGTTQQKDKKRKTPDDKDHEEIEALNTEFKAPEYTPTESAKGALGKLSLMGEPVSAASMERLARSLENMAQKSPGGAKVLHNHVRLELKIKKYTPTKPTALPSVILKPQSTLEKKKHGNYPDLDLSFPKKFTCAICSKQYKREAILEQHMALCKFPQKKDKKKFECTLCEKKYGRIGHLKKHLLSHNRGPKKPVVAHLEGIVCAVCSKTFKYDRDFEDHMNAHTGQKPHVCPNCDKGFAAGSNLKDHMRHYCSEQK